MQCRLPYTAIRAICVALHDDQLEPQLWMACCTKSIHASNVFIVYFHITFSVAHHHGLCSQQCLVQDTHGQFLYFTVIFLHVLDFMFQAYHVKVYFHKFRKTEAVQRSVPSIAVINVSRFHEHKACHIKHAYTK